MNQASGVLSTHRLSLLRGLRHRPDADSRQVFIGLQQVRSRPVYDLEKIIHRRNFFELFGQKPLQKIDRDVSFSESARPTSPLICCVTWTSWSRESFTASFGVLKFDFGASSAGITTRPPASTTYLIKRRACPFSSSACLKKCCDNCGNASAAKCAAIA